MGKKKDGEFRPRLTQEEFDVVREMRQKVVMNVNNNSALDLHLIERGIDKDDVVSVKHWQSASGEYRFSVVTKEQAEYSIEALFSPILKELQQYSPKIKRIRRHAVKEPHCLVLDPADVHVGKLATIDETGEHYNIKEAVKRVEEGISGILRKSSGFNLDQIIFIIGNDVLHIDTPHRKTTSGTPQDTDGMWHEAFQAAKSMYIKAIEKLLPVADVHVVFNPSNHDYTSGYMLAQTLEAYYRRSVNVTFDTSINHRKYTSYGTSMIASTHGDGAKLDNIPLLMATENPEMWNDCPHRYIYLHHVHHKQTHKFMSGKDFIGVTAEYVRSPSASDGWHHRNGFVGAKKAIEAFIHSRDGGQVARITHLF